METKRLRKITLAISLLLAAAGPAIAQAYPNKPVKLVVPFPPGGGTDIVGRLIAQKLSDAWQQTVIVDNKPGANTLIGTEFVAKAPSDGYGVQQWWGIVVPSGTPKEVVKKINADVTKILESQSVRDQLAAIGAEPGNGSPEQFDSLIRNEIVQWGKLIESAKIVAD